MTEKRMMKKRASLRSGLIGFFGLIVLLLSFGCAHREVKQQSQVEPPSEPAKVEMTEFGLGIGDEVEVTVYQHPDLSRKIRIPASGIIFFPLVGEVNARGMGITELRRQLTAGLKDAIVSPQVSVEVTTLRSQKVYVLGEVNAPAAFSLESPILAMEAVSRAGGFTQNASQASVMLIRGGGENPKLKQLDLEAFLKKGIGSENMSLQPGDILYVPKTFVADMDRFFQHVLTALYPVLVLEQGIALYPSVQDTLTGKVERSRTTNVIVTVPPAP